MPIVCSETQRLFQPSEAILGGVYRPPITGVQRRSFACLGRSGWQHNRGGRAGKAPTLYERGRRRGRAGSTDNLFRGCRTTPPAVFPKCFMFPSSSSISERTSQMVFGNPTSVVLVMAICSLRWYRKIDRPSHRPRNTMHQSKQLLEASVVW